MKKRNQVQTVNTEGKYLIIGLGNPGIKYENTRHNLGFKAVDLFCRDLNLHLADQRFQALTAILVYHGKQIALACPQTFMNRSGIAVYHLINYYRPEIRDILVIHDDIDLDFGRIKILAGGGSGGHRGVESIIVQLETKEFVRIKIGVGRPRYGETIEEFVLSPLYDDQEVAVGGVLQLVKEAIQLFILEGLGSAMNKFNTVTVREKEEKG